MGNITNLATTGNYATETNGLKVSFSFEIDNKTQKLKRVANGNVTENDRSVASFNSEMYSPMEMGERVNMYLTKGREVELATVITDAITALEVKITQGEVSGANL